MAKKSLDQLKRQMEQAEARMKKLRAEAKRITDKEAAEVRADVIRAVDELRLVLPGGPREMSDMPGYIRALADGYRNGTAERAHEEGARF